MTLAPASGGRAERMLDALAASRAVPRALAETFWDPDRCPAEWLPVLAWALRPPACRQGAEVCPSRASLRAWRGWQAMGGTDAALTALAADAGGVGVLERLGAFRQRLTLFGGSVAYVQKYLPPRRKRASVAVTVAVGATATGVVSLAGGAAAVVFVRARLDVRTT